MTNQVILLDSFIGASPGSPAEISIVTEAELERRIGGKIARDFDTGFYTVKGKAVAARLKRMMRSSSWILIDGDSPPGMPAQWARLSLAERLKLLEPILPGISTCLRIEYRGSSARVVNGSGAQNRADTRADRDFQRRPCSTSCARMFMSNQFCMICRSSRPAIRG